MNKEQNSKNKDLTANFGNTMLSDEEEIQQWLDNEGDENDYEFIQL